MAIGAKLTGTKGDQHEQQKQSKTTDSSTGKRITHEQQPRNIHRQKKFNKGERHEKSTE